jgi:hypothetical protein
VECRGRREKKEEAKERSEREKRSQQPELIATGDPETAHDRTLSTEGEKG